jgi:hypothetical protein
MSLWPNVREWVNLSIALFLGGVIGFLTTSYFESATHKAELEREIATAIARGSAQGAEAARSEFLSTAPDRLFALFPSVYDDVRNLAFDAGVADGLQKGREEGLALCGEESYAEGFAEGQRQGASAANKSCEERGLSERRDLVGRMDEYVDDWNNYERLANDLGLMAEKVKNEEDIVELLAQAEALANIAITLKLAYAEQSSSFNSIVDQIKSALASDDVDSILRLAPALRESMSSKRDRFLTNKKTELEAFYSIGGL